MVETNGRFSEGKKSTSSWQRFGLIRDPFSNDSDEIFAIPQWKENLDLLQHLSANSNVLLVATGQMNSGKSTLLNEFITWHTEGTFYHRVEGYPRFNLEKLAEVLSSSFNLPSFAADVPATQKLPALFKKMQPGDLKYLLIIDDAEQLPSDTLQVLLEMVGRQSVEKANFRVMLFGLPELIKRLNKIAEEITAKSLLHHIDIKPMSFKDTKRYIQHRFVNAGLTGSHPLDENELARIYKLSEGYPGRINQVAKQAMLDKTATKAVPCKLPSIKKSNKSRPAVLGFGAAAVLAGVGFLFLGQDNVVAKTVNLTIPNVNAANVSASKRIISAGNNLSLVAQQQVQLQQKQIIDARINQQQQALKLAEVIVEPVLRLDKDNVLTQMITLPEQQPAHRTEQQAQKIHQQSTNVHSAALEPTSSRPKKVAETFISFEQAYASNGIQASQPQTKIADSSATIRSDKAARRAITENAIIGKQNLSIDTEDEQVQTDQIEFNAASTPNQNQLQILDEQAARQGEIIVDVAAKMVTMSQESKTQVQFDTQVSAQTQARAQFQGNSQTTAKLKFSPMEKAILATDSKLFAIQLMGAENKDALLQFVRSNHLNGAVSYFKTGYNGHDYYVLIYGQYENPELAVKAIKQMPVGVRTDSPWPRRYSEIQRAIRTQNEV